MAASRGAAIGQPPFQPMRQSAAAFIVSQRDDMALKKKIFNLISVTVAGETKTGQVDVRDTQAKKIVGIALRSDLPAQLTGRGRISLRSDNMEISPREYPASAFLIGGQNVPPDQRLYTKLGAFEIGSGYIDYEYADTPGAVVFAPYAVDLIVEYEY